MNDLGVYYATLLLLFCLLHCFTEVTFKRHGRHTKATQGCSLVTINS